MYLYGLRDTLEVDIDHKPPVPLLVSYKATSPLRNERRRVRLQGFNYKLNYVPVKKANAEVNEADYNSRHPEPITMQDTGVESQTEWTVSEDEEVVEKDIREAEQGALPDAVSWDELLEETSQDPELKKLKSAIARGLLHTRSEKKTLGPQFEPVFITLAVVGGLVVRGSRIGVPRALRDKVVRLAHEEHQYTQKTQANVEAEQFMRLLMKLYRICRLIGQNFRQAVHRFLHCYRATPLGTTKLAPAELMFPGYTFRTRLPAGVTPRQMVFEEPFQCDLEKKMRMKAYADGKKGV